ncbi:MAG: hypothetical protein KDA24_02880 [Deltaproteobacteria bacterium]|nr:hypothetical protein [Deltaproteobacteria bacterium]
MRLALAALTVALAVPTSALAQTDRPQLSSTWRAAAEAGPDNPTGDPGVPLRAGGYLDDASWRMLDEHAQQYHFGLWTAEEVAALEQMSGVQMAVMAPVPGSDELGVVQWPDRVNRGGIFLVAIADADPGTDWVLRPVGDVPEAGMPPVDGPASATALPTSSGFYRVHRVVGADAFRGRRALYRAEKVELNSLGLETELALTSDSVRLEPGSTIAGPQVLAAGSYTVRDADGPLVAPLVVNLSLQGPSAELFTLEVLPAAGEPALASSRDVRVRDRILFRVLAPPAMIRGGMFVDRALPPGGSLMVEIQAEVVSFSNDDGEELDAGLSTVGFSVAPGVPVVFGPSRQAPASVVRLRAPLEVWRPMPSAPEPAAEE